MTRGSIVVICAPLPACDRRGPERVALQGAHARRALALAAESVGTRLGTLTFDQRGAPLPCNGWHWSVSHSRSWVAACVHRAEVGIDVEDVRLPREAVVERALSAAECANFALTGAVGFTRAWTAKEAVLKEVGIGLAGLDACRIAGKLADDEFELVWNETRHRVRQNLTNERIVSIATRLDGTATAVQWLAFDSPLPEPGS